MANYCVALVTVSLMLFSPSIFAYSGKVTYVQGDVTKLSKGKTSGITQGSDILAGDSLTTAQKSLAIIVMDDGAQIKLNEKTHLSIPMNLEGELSLHSGSIFSKIQKQKVNQKFNIRTRVAVMGVRGTYFFTSYGPDTAHESDVWMCVREGVVNVSSLVSDKQVDVKEGEGVLIPSGSDVTAPKKYTWTKQLNWNLDPKTGDVENKTKIKYQKSLLNEDYN